MKKQGNSYHKIRGNYFQLYLKPCESDIKQDKTTTTTNNNNTKISPNQIKDLWFFFLIKTKKQKKNVVNYIQNFEYLSYNKCVQNYQRTVIKNLMPDTLIKVEQRASID